ncbi:MAG: tRNA modification GTPase [Pirellulaceae bacterium]
MISEHTTLDTIAAIASADSVGLRGIIRISGAETRCAVESVFSPFDSWQSIDQFRGVRAWEGEFQVCETRIPGMLMYWPDQRSYTRQPSAELHVPGCKPVLDSLLKSLCMGKARLARPGEFTLRAFLGGRIDLTQAEAVLATINAEEKSEFENALRQLSGGLASPFSTSRETLLNLLADIEAGLDFVDEDIEFVSSEIVCRTLEDERKRLVDLRDQIERRTDSKTVPSIVLCGHPNAGKSSLFNALLRESVAVVSDVAGTTRDFLTARILVDGLTLELVDTAGIDIVPTQNSIEGQSQNLARSKIEQAKLLCLCVDLSRPVTDWEQAFIETHSGQKLLVSGTKADVAKGDGVELDLATSTVSNVGLDEFMRKVVEKIEALNQNETSGVLATHIRCFESVCRAEEALSAALHASMNHMGDEIVATEIRLALESIGEIIGVVHNEDVLDRLFSRFCIGK